MYKIGVIGDRESILGFKAVGLTVFPCDEAEEAKKILKQIKEEKSRNVTSNGDVEVTNNGNNSGVISGINSGEIRS